MSQPYNEVDSINQLELFRKLGIFFMIFIAIMTFGLVIAGCIFLPKLNHDFYGMHPYNTALYSVIFGVICGMVAVSRHIWVRIIFGIVIILTLAVNIFLIYQYIETSFDITDDKLFILFFFIFLLGTYLWMYIYETISTKIKNFIFTNYIPYEHKYGNDEIEKFVLDTYKEKFPKLLHRPTFVAVDDCFFGDYKGHKISLYECRLCHQVGSGKHSTIVVDFDGILLIADMKFSSIPENDSDSLITFETDKLYYWVADFKENFEVYVFKSFEHSFSRIPQINDQIQNILSVIDKYSEAEN